MIPPTHQASVKRHLHEHHDSSHSPSSSHDHSHDHISSHDLSHTLQMLMTGLSESPHLSAMLEGLVVDDKEETEAMESVKNNLTWGPPSCPSKFPTVTFVPFLPRRAFGVVNGVSRPPHGHGSFYAHRPPGLVDVLNSPRLWLPVQWL
ncbi:hypothetical protein O3P69_017452 [Scylla paramamosain]|uniref:Uncharacterized protein n=1 Tax=Scylla paramamosain TaxID=85552 RepID=A0AAW0TVT7_SCYPA